MEDGKFLEKGLELADRFKDFHWITALCEVLDEQQSSGDSWYLDTYLQRYSDSGLSEYVLDWYQDKLKEGRQQGKLLAKIQRILEKIERLEATNMSTRTTETSTSSAIVGKFLERSEVQSTRWLHEIETDEFGQAARTLARLGEGETGSLGRKKHLLSLAKLSCLAATTEGGRGQGDELLHATSNQLRLIAFQEDVPPAVVQAQLGFATDGYSQPPIAVSQLVRLLLASGQTALVVRALELLDWCGRSAGDDGLPSVGEAEFDELRAAVWGRTVAMDE